MRELWARTIVLSLVSGTEAMSKREVKGKQCATRVKFLDEHKWTRVRVKAFSSQE